MSCPRSCDHLVVTAFLRRSSNGSMPSFSANMSITLLDCGSNLSDPKSSECPADGVVGVHGLASQARVGNTVRSPRVFQAQRQHHSAKMVVRPGIQVYSCIHKVQCPVFLGAQSIVHASRVALAPRTERLFPIPPHLHRSARRMKCSQAQQRLDSHSVLAAERATHVRHDDADHGRIQSQRLRDFGAVSKGRLGSSIL